MSGAHDRRESRRCHLLRCPPASHLLVIVHGIDLDLVNGAWVATNGTPVVYDPWEPEDSELTVVRYRWKPKPGRPRA